MTASRRATPGPQPPTTARPGDAQTAARAPAASAARPAAPAHSNQTAPADAPPHARTTPTAHPADHEAADQSAPSDRSRRTPPRRRAHSRPAGHPCNPRAGSPWRHLRIEETGNTRSVSARRDRHRAISASAHQSLTTCPPTAEPSGRANHDRDGGGSSEQTLLNRERRNRTEFPSASAAQERARSRGRAPCLLAALEADHGPAHVDTHHDQSCPAPDGEQRTESKCILSPRSAVEADNDREIRTAGGHIATVGTQRGKNIRRQR
jgi:hypothetical protein